jgi:hypothetical protein
MKIKKIIKIVNIKKDKIIRRKKENRAAEETILPKSGEITAI